MVRRRAGRNRGRILPPEARQSAKGARCRGPGAASPAALPCPAVPCGTGPSADRGRSFDRNVELTWRAARGSRPGGRSAPRGAATGAPVPRRAGAEGGFSASPPSPMSDCATRSRPIGGRTGPPGLSSSGCPSPASLSLSSHRPGLAWPRLCSLFPSSPPRASPPPSFIYSFSPL